MIMSKNIQNIAINTKNIRARAKVTSLRYAKKQSEKDIEPYLVGKIKKLGGMCIKMTSQGTAGLPDRLCLLPNGEMSWVEIKSEGMKPRKLQQIMFDKLRALGQYVYVCDTKEKVDEAVDEMKFFSEGNTL